jgi:hypothetical protein
MWMCTVADCHACGREGVDFAHGAWEALAATLAEPLWRAFLEHTETCVRCAAHGSWDCPTGRRRLELLPEGYVIAIGASHG